MLYFKICIVLFICFTLIKCEDFEKLISDISTYVNVIQSTEPHIFDVTVNQDIVSTIFMFTTENQYVQNRYKDIDVFYIGLCCTFAHWTLNTVYHFVKTSPLFSPNTSDPNESDKCEFKFHFNKQFMTFIKKVDTDVALLIAILNNFLNMMANHQSYYKDTSLLTALLSLQMNTYFLSFNYYNDRSVLPYDIFRILTKDMTAVQSYLSVNCSKMNDDNDIYNGYWLDKSIRKSVRRYLPIRKILQFINLDPNEEFQCLPTQTILEELIIDDEISIYLLNTNVTVKNSVQMDNVILSINDFYYRMKTSYDIDTVFWYQDSLIATIMKSIVSEIINGLDNDEFYLNYFRVFIVHIYRSIYRNNIHFPEYFVEGFKMLYKLNVKNNKSRDELQHFQNLLTRVHWEYDFDESTRLQYLTILLKKISENLYSFKCFQQTYNCLRNKHERHNLPFINEITIFAPDNIVQNFEMVHDFLVIIYSMCFKVSKILIPIDEIPRNWNTQLQTYYHFNELQNILENILHYMLVIIKKRTYNMGLLKMANDIASILVNLPKTLHNVYKCYIVRLVDLFMNTLMSTGLEYCTPSKSNCLLHHYTNTFDLENKKLIEKKIAEGLNTSVLDFTVKDLDSSRVNITDYNYLSISYLYQNFVRNSGIIQHYQACIQFTWKGQPYTIINMFKIAQSDILYPDTLRTLYDVIFKFYISVIYYLIKKALVSMNWKMILKELRKIFTRYNFEDIYFPEEMKLFILNIKSLSTFIDMLNADNEKAMDELIRHIKKIDKLIKRFNIILNLTMSCENISYNDPSLLSRRKSYERFNEELFNNVISLTILFKQFTNFGIQQLE